MNENINLCEILKDCPKGTRFWSPLAGVVIFKDIENDEIRVILDDNSIWYINSDSTQSFGYIANAPITSKEIMLYPSIDQRDWSKWECPKPKKPKFDPKTFKVFDKVLARHKQSNVWFPDFYSFFQDDNFATIGNGYYNVVIPYNEETKHLVGTSDEAPDFYKYWED